MNEDLRATSAALRGPENALAGPLTAVRRAPLARIPAAQAARVVRRIVDGEQAPRLDVAAFNSAA